MPEFRYQATDAQGAVVKGVLTVEDQTEAMTQLQRRGLMVFEMQEVAASRSSRISQPKRAGAMRFWWCCRNWLLYWTPG
jgi:type II secretory pathway component PulF